MNRNDLLTLAQRLREYNHNPHHINPTSEAFHKLIDEAASALSILATPPADAADMGGQAGEEVDLVKLQHMAIAEGGQLRWMTGRKIDECLLYAMPDWGRAPELIEAAKHRRILAQRDAAIEEWSGTAVQNGMECDRLREELKAASELIREADGWVRVLRTQFGYPQTQGLAERIEAWQERNHA